MPIIAITLISAMHRAHEVTIVSILITSSMEEAAPVCISGGATCLTRITCLALVYFKRGEYFGELWWSLTLYTAHTTDEAVLDK